MSTNFATSLTVTSQVYDPVTDKVTATFTWARGTSTAGETIVNQTFVLSESSNINCGAVGVGKTVSSTILA